MTVRKLKPNRERMERMKGELTSAQATLGQRHLHLDSLQGELEKKAVHQEEFQAQIRDIQSQMKGLRRTVHAAEGLLEFLRRKKEQWTVERDQLLEQLQMADGDAMLAAGAVTYFGPFSAECRATFLEKWKDPGGVKRVQSFITEGVIPRSPMFDFLSLLRPAVPSGVVGQDTHTLENILIIRELLRHSRRQILVSDPDNQLREWGDSLVSQVGSSEFCSGGGGSTVRFSDSASEFANASIASEDLVSFPNSASNAK